MSRVIIELSGLRVQLGVMRRGVLVAHRQQLLEALSVGPGTDFSAVLRACEKTVAEWVGELGLSGQAVCVLHQSGSAVSAVLSGAMKLGKGGALSAGRLALGELAPFPLGTNPHDLEPLCVDAMASTTDPKRHTLGTADLSSNTMALAEWAGKLGLRPTRLTPGDALVMKRAARSASGPGDAGAVRAVLWLGESGSVLAVGSPGRLRFVRSLGVGAGALVDALTRPMRGRAESEAAVVLKRGEALALLEAQGIPRPQQTIDQERGLEGSAALPLLQPVLQRLAIDIKQSLRFGLNEAERAGVTLWLDGPFAAVPRLSEVIGQNAGITVGTGDGPGRSVNAWAELPGCELNLLPEPLERAATLERVRHGMWAGVGVAGLAVVLYGALTWLTLGSEEQRLVMVQRQKAALSERLAVSQRAREAERESVATRWRVQTVMGARAPWPHVLGLLAESVPVGVKLTSVDLTGVEDDKLVCAVSGVIDQKTAGSDFAAVLEQFSRSLGASAIVQSVRLGSVQREATGEGAQQRFDLSVQVVGVPMGGLAEAGRGGQGGER
jgi:Tfp pilus assembly protein PilN